MIRLLLICLLIAHPAQACRLALILSMDVSSSVDGEEYDLQKNGTAWALQQPDVMQLLLSPADPVAIMVYEWSGRYDQVVISDWVMLRSADDLAILVDRLHSHTRSRADMPTALGFSMAWALRQFRDVPTCARRKIDVSGDGLNNEATNPSRIYQLFDFSTVTVNGLAIGDDEIVQYYHRNLIYGHGAFVEWAQGYGDLADTMHRKLLRELSTPIT